MPNIFVYGTLRRPVGGSPGDTKFHSRISHSIITAQAATLDGAILYDLGTFPGVLRGAGVVVGEVFEIDDHALSEADVIEGHPSFYERNLETVTMSNGSVLDAWVYWAPAALIGDRPAVDGGDWFKRNRAEIDSAAADELAVIIARVQRHDQSRER